MYETSLLVHPSTPISRDQLLEELRQFYARSKNEPPALLARAVAGIEVRFPDYVLRIDWDRLPHVIEESQEIAERYGKSTGKMDRIAACSTRFDVSGDDDPDMSRFNDFVYLVEAAQRLGEVYAFDSVAADFI